MEYRFERRDRKRQKKLYGMRIDNKSIFNIVEIQHKKGKKKMASVGYNDALLECGRTRDGGSVANLLVAYLNSHQITKEEAESIWWATRRCPVPKEVRKRLGLGE